MGNKVILTGIVGGDPKIKETVNTRIIDVCVGVNEKEKKDGESQYVTNWHYVTFFGATADYIFSHVPKNSIVHIEGRLKKSTYEKNGEQQTRTTVIGYSIERLKKGEESKPKTQKPADDFDDDIPF